MSLLRKIQEDASNVNVPVNQLLINAKVLAARLGHEELKTWVNLELKGYGGKDKLPPYRVLKELHIMGDFAGPFGAGMKHAPIPLTGFPPDIRDKITTHELYEPIGALQELLRGEASQNPVVPISAEMLQFLSVFQGYRCMSAHIMIPRGAIVKIVDSVRARLVDLALEIEALNPKAGEAELGSEPVPRERISQIFNVTVMGGQNNIAAGSSDFSQSIEDGIRVGDIVSLMASLKNLGIGDEDAKELEQAIAQDGKPKDAKSLGQRVTAWLGRMFTKAASGAWKVTTGVAAEVLPKLILNHYGIGERQNP